MPFYPSYRYRSYLHPMAYNPLHYGGMGMGMPIGMVPGMGIGMGMGMGMGMPYPLVHPVATPIPVPIANPVPVGVPIGVPQSAPVYGHGHGGYGMTAPPLQAIHQASTAHHIYSHSQNLSPPPTAHSITNNTHHHHHKPSSHNSNNQLQRHNSRSSQHSNSHLQIPNSPAGTDPRRRIISIKVRPRPMSDFGVPNGGGRGVIPVYERVTPAPNHNCR